MSLQLKSLKKRKTKAQLIHRKKLIARRAELTQVTQEKDILRFRMRYWDILG